MNKQLPICATCAINFSKKGFSKIKPSKKKKHFLYLLIFGFTLCYSNKVFSGVVVINTTVTWSIPTDVPADANDYGIQIVNGGKLTISNLSISFAPTSKIYVGYKSQLILDNATLTVFNPSTNDYWLGINYNDVDPCDAQSESEQFQVFPDHSILDNNTAWEGVLRTSNTPYDSHPIIILNNSTISRAKVGITSKCGQIIRAKKSQFIDCEIGCKVRNYESTKSPHVNACYFIDCTFKWTKTIATYTQTNLIGLELFSVKGVNIGGCIFTNENTATTCPNERGRGIVSINSEFVLSKSGNTFCNDNSSYMCSNNCWETGSSNTSNRNIFSSLWRGIDSKLNPGYYFNPAIAVVLRNSDFTNNLNSVYLDGGQFKILDCAFSGSRTTLNGLFTSGACYSSASVVKDVEIDQSYGYEIYATSFSFTGKDITHVLVGGNNFVTSRIQKNTFDNNSSLTVATDNVTGIVFLRANTEVDIKCNTFTNMGTDIKVGGSNSIKLNQGSMSLGAGNHFSNQLIGRYRIDNTSGTIIHYYSDGNNVYSNSLYPVNSPNSAAAVGIQMELASSIPENTACEILCMSLISSVKSVKFVTDINIIPQPANDEIKVKLINNYMNFLYCNIYNINGELISTQIIDNIDNIIVNTKEFSNGMYVLRLVNQESASVYKKILIQH